MGLGAIFEMQLHQSFPWSCRPLFQSPVLPGAHHILPASLFRSRNAWHPALACWDDKHAHSFGKHLSISFINEFLIPRVYRLFSSLAHTCLYALHIPNNISINFSIFLKRYIVFYHANKKIWILQCSEVCDCSDLDKNIFSFLTLVWTLRLGGILIRGSMLSWMEFQQCRSVSKGISRPRAISLTLVEGRLRSLEKRQSLWQRRCCPGPYCWTLVEVMQGEEAARWREYCLYRERGVLAFSRWSDETFFFFLHDLGEVHGDSTVPFKGTRPGTQRPLTRLPSWSVHQHSAEPCLGPDLNTYALGTVTSKAWQV